MKKAKLSVLVLLCVVFVFSFIGCTPAETKPQATVNEGTEVSAEPVASEEPAPEVKKFKFLFVPKLVHPWYDDVKKGIEQAIGELKAQGIEVEYEWDAPPVPDSVDHAQRLEAAISKNPDAIAVSVLDEALCKPIIQQAVDNGVKIITFDTDGPTTARASYVGHADNASDGAACAENLAKAMNFEGEVAILVGSPSAVNHKERVAGFKEVIKKYPNMSIVTEQADNDELEKAVKLTENILAQYPNVKGIFGCNATNPIGAGTAVKAAVEAGKLQSGQVTIVGMDDMPETIKFIEEGIIYSTQVQNVKDIGYYAILTMVDYCMGKEIPAEHPTGSYTVMKDNLAEYHEKSGK